MKRKLLAAFAAILAAGALLRAAAVQGLLTPVRVAGPSMAETLVGRHLRLVCADCRFPFRCDAERLPETGQAVCPNCGYARNALPGEHPGERVLLDRGAFALRGPGRWDLVALRDADRKLSVKRVVGLPGERLSMRRGDLYVDGRILRKSLGEFRRLATLVHDDHYRPLRSPTPPRWSSESESWRPTTRGYRFDAPAASQNKNDGLAKDWLVYHHWRCYAGPHARTDEAPISDNCAYNQAESRELHNVTDVLLACRVTVPARSSLELRMHDGYGFVTASLDLTSNRVAVRRDNQTAEASRRWRFAEGDSWQLEFGVFDQQALLAINGRVAVRRIMEDRSGPGLASARPIGIAVAGAWALLEDLKVFRDIHYFAARPRRNGRSDAIPLGVDELFVLGDNTALSRDSRHWTEAQPRRNALRGRVLALGY